MLFYRILVWRWLLPRSICLYRFNILGIYSIALALPLYPSLAWFCAMPPSFTKRTDDAINNFNFQIITNLCGNFTYFVHCSAVAVFVSLIFVVVVDDDDEDACYAGSVLICSMLANRKNGFSASAWVNKMREKNWECQSFPFNFVQKIGKNKENWLSSSSNVVSCLKCICILNAFRNE